MYITAGRKNRRLQGLSQQYYGQPPSVPPPVPRRSLPVDPWVLGAIFVAALAGLTCLVAVGLLALRFLVPTPPPPATPRPAPTSAVAGVLPAASPTFNPAYVGQYINPYLSAGLQNMIMIQIDLRDPATGNYVRMAQVTGDALDKFAEAFNVSVKMTAPDPTCQDHVRMSITRSDNSVLTIGICLKGVVILRSGILDLGGADAPMYPGFSDAIAPYLTDAYKNLLDF
jgi:hypothetical protein